MSNLKCNVKDSKIKDSVILYKNIFVNNSTLQDFCKIGDDSVIDMSFLNDKVIINRRNYISNSYLDSYTYTGIGTIIRSSKVGKFCSIGPGVDIGGIDHDYTMFTTLPIERFKQLNGENYNVSHISKEYVCEIGNDVWISANATVLGKCKLGVGCIVAAGAVVTKDVPPYAIVAGVPARIIKYRFEKDVISELLSLRLWDLEDDLLMSISDILFYKQVNTENINIIKDIIAKNREN